MDTCKRKGQQDDAREVDAPSLGRIYLAVENVDDNTPPVIDGIPREKSMHFLLEEYTWLSKDIDENAIAVVRNIDYFYIDPDFPAQEQHCLGSILADEIGLGKTIEMLSQIHSHHNVAYSQSSNGISSAAELPRFSNVSATQQRTRVQQPAL